MASTHAKKTVGTTAVSLNPITSTYFNGRVLSDYRIQNTGAAAVYVGIAGVTTSVYGYKIPAGGEVGPIRTKDELFAISTASGNDCFVLATSV